MPPRRRQCARGLASKQKHPQPDGAKAPDRLLSFVRRISTHCQIPTERPQRPQADRSSSRPVQTAITSAGVHVRRYQGGSARPESILPPSGARRLRARPRTPAGTVPPQEHQFGRRMTLRDRTSGPGRYRGPPADAARCQLTGSSSSFCWRRRSTASEEPRARLLQERRPRRGFSVRSGPDSSAGRWCSPAPAAGYHRATAPAATAMCLAVPAPAAQDQSASAQLGAHVLPCRRAPEVCRS